MNLEQIPPAQDPVLESDELEWQLFWHRHKQHILLGGLALILAIGGIIGWYVSNTLSTRAAEEALASAADGAGFETVVQNYPRSLSAADALLLIAGTQRAEGKISDSTATFQKFLKDFPDHPLAGGALLGVGQNLDALGDAQQAATIYQQVVAQYPKSYAAPFASYAQAEILLRDFRRDEARRILDSILVQFPQSQVARFASAQLARIGPATSVEVVAPSLPQ